MVTDVKDEVSEWIALFREERQRQGLSQQGLAKKMGIGQSNISHWEAGKVQPQAYSFFHWAQTLGFDMRPVRRVKR